MADLPTVALSAGIGAAVSAIGLLVASKVQAGAQERIATATHAHEAQLKRLEDERALRDAKRERLRVGLLMVADVAMRLLDAVQRLGADPRGQMSMVTASLLELAARIEDHRAGLVLDSESDQLLVSLFAAIRGYQGLANTWTIQIQTVDATKGGAPGRDAAVALAERADRDRETLEANIHVVIAKAREVLAELERPV